MSSRGAPIAHANRHREGLTFFGLRRSTQNDLFGGGDGAPGDGGPGEVRAGRMHTPISKSSPRRSITTSSSLPATSVTSAGSRGCGSARPSRTRAPVDARLEKPACLSATSAKPAEQSCVHPVARTRGREKSSRNHFLRPLSPSQTAAKLGLAVSTPSPPKGAPRGRGWGEGESRGGNPFIWREQSSS